MAVAAAESTCESYGDIVVEGAIYDGDVTAL